MSQIDWIKIKNEYINTPTSYRKLAEKYGVNKDTIGKRAKAENWTKTKDIHTDKKQTAVIQKTAAIQVAKEVDRITRIASAADMLLAKVEEATVQLDGYLVTNKVKVKTVEYDSSAKGKPAKEITTETENLEVVNGIIDKMGLKQIASALKDIYTIVEPMRNTESDQAEKHESLVSAIKKAVTDED